ncbi:hypothetical protein O9992_24765 [Vibrio lentus]|nr:hypothetical protein [Vibrio lentus]
MTDIPHGLVTGKESYTRPNGLGRRRSASSQCQSRPTKQGGLLSWDYVTVKRTEVLLGVLTQW